MRQFLPLPIALLTLGIGLLAWHFKVWRVERLRDHDPAEQTYFRRQFLRRATVGLLLVACAGLMAGGMTIPHKQFPASFAACWIGAILAVFALIVAALFDMAANRRRVVRLRNEQLVARAILKAQLGRVNGKPD